ncbi:hypothetical protein ACFQ1L_44155 [Phytohabitans flavus]|uniref:hypothetical protein n=1 Tax=Phytohabitans flavus TaxID=1076124 RepID=UPI00362C595B
MLDKRLYHHLVTWLGQWPAGKSLAVVGSERRTQPAWDGKVYPMVGVGAPTGTVISVPPPRAAAVRVLSDQPLDDLLAKLPTALGLDAGRRAYRGCTATRWIPCGYPRRVSGCHTTTRWCRSGCGPSAATCSSPATRTPGSIWPA